MVRSNKSNRLDFDLSLPSKPSDSGGAWGLVCQETHPWAWAADVFTDAELDSIINIGKSLSLVQAKTFGASTKEVRHSEVAFFYPNDSTAWVFERLTGIINAVNEQYFKFDLWSIDSGIQFTQYQHVKNSEPQHYDWHIDLGKPVSNRKLSLSLQLTDPSTYDGGDLQVNFGRKSETSLPKERGTINFFPSYTMHRVTPVTRGTRHSIVCWVSGPQFR